MIIFGIFRIYNIFCCSISTVYLCNIKQEKIRLYYAKNLGIILWQSKFKMQVPSYTRTATHVDNQTFNTTIYLAYPVS